MKNCNTCKNDEEITGCKLKGIGGLCVSQGFSHYKKDETKKLIHCERCNKNSVREYIGGLMIIPPNPHIAFWCLECDDYPIVNSNILSKKELSKEDKEYWFNKTIAQQKIDEHRFTF
jgi:hypothetical protein